jgi:hypothetical protein
MKSSGKGPISYTEDDIALNHFRDELIALVNKHGVTCTLCAKKGESLGGAVLGPADADELVAMAAHTSVSVMTAIETMITEGIEASLPPMYKEAINKETIH